MCQPCQELVRPLRYPTECWAYQNGTIFSKYLEPKFSQIWHIHALKFTWGKHFHLYLVFLKPSFTRIAFLIVVLDTFIRRILLFMLLVICYYILKEKIINNLRKVHNFSLELSLEEEKNAKIDSLNKSPTRVIASSS